MAGFGSTLSKLIEEDRQYYRAKAEKRKDYLQTYGTKAVVDIEGKANDALAVANQLQNYGFSKEFVTGITAKGGVRSMYDFANQVLKRTDLTPDDIKELETAAVDFVSDNPDQDLETVINRAYGLYKSESDPVKRKTGMFGAMLGLDAQALEEDVLNDFYYNGYSGTDLTRIAATSGPKAGKPLGIKLPPKPISVSDLGSINKVIGNQFDTSVSRQLDELSTITTSDTSSTEERQNAQAKIQKLKELQTIAKTNEGEAMAMYISNPEYEGGDFLTYLQGIEATKLGAISKNFLLGDYFKTTYRALTAGEDVPVKVGTNNTLPGTNNTPTTTPVSFETANQFDAAVEAGKIKPGALIKIGNNAPQTFSPPPSYKYKTKDAFPLEEDNRSRLLSETTDTMPLEEDDRSRLLSEATAPEPMTPASAQGQEHRELIADLGGAISEGWESGNTLLASSDAAGRGALFNGIANFVDYFGALAFNDMESSPLAGSLRKAAEAQKEKAAEIAAEGWAKYIEDKTGQEVPYTETEKAKELFSTRVAQYPMRLPGETPQGFMIRTGKQLPGPEVLTGEQSVEPLDITDYKSTMSTFIPQVLSRIDYGQNNVRDIKDILFELEPYSPDARNYGKGRTTIKTKEDLKDWLKPYFASRGIGVEFTPEQEKTFIDVTFDVYQQVQDMKEEGVLRRVQDQDRQFLADEKNYPQPITGFVTPAKTEEEKKLEAEMVQVDEALRRVQDLDRQFLADEKNYPQPISAMTSVDPLSINTRSDLRSAISERTGTMPPDYKEQMVSAVASVNEALKTFEDSVNIKTKNAIDAVSLSNINEAITNIVDRMFDTVVGNETLEDRIMKTEAGQNRAYALTKLQDQFGALTFFPERIPGEIDLGPTMGEIASEALHSTQDKINESIASAFKSLLSKIGIGKPEPLVRKPR